MSAFPSDPARIVVLGAECCPRAEAFRNALIRLGHPPARFVSYDSFAQDPPRLAEALRPGSILRFDSPERDKPALEALYRAGAADAAGAGYAALKGTALDAALSTDGAIGSPAQLAFGIRNMLARAADMATRCGASLLADPAEIATAFDKTSTSRWLAQGGVPLAPFLGNPSSFDELLEMLRTRRRSRAFVKLRFGSSAAGMTALALGPQGSLVAYTTLVIDGDGLLRATRAVRRLTSRAEIAQIIDRLAPLGLHAECWLPKAGVAGKLADLRVIAVNGQPVFNVMRLSRHPMTNLHLAGSRHTPDLMRDQTGEKAWARLLESCRAVARLFPSCFMLGLDAAILANRRDHAILEVNAFGDHVKGVRYEGRTPQEWQILQYRTLAAAA